LTWGQHGGVHLWSIATCAPVVTLSDPSLDQVSDAVANPAGTVIATAGGPGEGAAALLFDARTGRLLHVLARSGPTVPTSDIPQQVWFSPSGRLVAGGTQNGTATVWNAQTGAIVQPLDLGSQSTREREPYVFSTVFSPNGKELATANQDENGVGQTVIWNVSNWSSKTVSGVGPVWSPGSAFVATTGEQGLVKVYTAATGRQYAQFAAGAPAQQPSSIGPDINGQLGNVITPTQNAPPQVWGSYGGSVVETLAGDSGLVVPAGYSPDGSRILTWSSDGAARIWDAGQAAAQPVAAPRAVRALKASAADFLVEPSYDEAAALVSPLRAYTRRGGALHVVNVRTGATLTTIPTDGAGFDAAAFDSAGRVLAVARSTPGSPSTIEPAELRSARSGALLHVLSGPGSRARGVVVSPNGQLVAAVDATGEIGVWDVATGRQLTVFARDEGARSNYESGQADLWFSPDSTLIVSGDMFGRTFVWRARTGAVLNAIRGMPEPPSGMYLGVADAISADGRLVVVSRSWENTASVYRVGAGAGRPLSTLQGPALAIDGVGFNADGSLIAAASADNTIRVWDTQHAAPLLTIQLPVGALDVSFSADGRSLVTDADNAFPYATIPCSICGDFPQLLAAARLRETRGFTPQERSSYLSN
jgi:WD40 repeat protein